MNAPCARPWSRRGADLRKTAPPLPRASSCSCSWLSRQQAPCFRAACFATPRPRTSRPRCDPRRPHILLALTRWDATYWRALSRARAVGAGPIRIVSRHLLPNALGIVIVYATLTVPVIILQESFLSFLGLTVPGQEHSWGTLLSEAVECVNPVNISWWLIVFPGSALTATLLALNFLGDGLRNALDPR